MKSHEYENLVKQLMTNLVERVDGLPACAVNYGRKNLVQGASGYKHQIDVSIQIPNEIHLIECKSWKKKVTPDALLTLAARLHDIRAANPVRIVKGALVTSTGYGHGVIPLAKFFAITLQQASSPQEFVLNYRDQIHLSVVDSLRVTDKAIVELSPTPKDRHDSED